MSTERTIKELTEKEREEFIEEVKICSDAINQEIEKIVTKYNLRVEAEILLKDIQT